MNKLQQMQQRVETGKIRGADIKVKGLLTVAQIAAITPTFAYGCVKTHQWSMKDFDKWLKAKVACDVYIAINEIQEY